jgi:DNA replication regulator DPB11
MSSSSFTAQTATRNEGGSSANGGSLLFAGLKFRALGEAKSANVRMAIDGCGGKMVSEGEGDEVDFIVVRLVRFA